MRNTKITYTLACENGSRYRTPVGNRKNVRKYTKNSLYL